MKVLMDTHIAIWALINDKKLPNEIREIVLDPDNALYFSCASVWEIALKHSLRPKTLTISGKEFTRYCEKAGFIPLDLKNKHICESENLIIREDVKHKDPFDRILIGQAKSEGMVLLTHDAALANYGETCVRIY